jgi:hypothetical protein
LLAVVVAIETQPNEPCRPDLLKEMFGLYGKTAKVPSLWIYTENDKYFGGLSSNGLQNFKTISCQSACRMAMPAFGDNGHFFSRFSIWRPVVDEFCVAKAFPFRTLPEVFKTQVLQISMSLPAYLSTKLRERYVKFLDLDLPRAFVLDAAGEFAGYAGGMPDALEKAMAICKKRAQRNALRWMIRSGKSNIREH